MTFPFYSDAPRPRGTILLFGKTERPEFAPIAADLKTMARSDGSFSVEEVRFLFDDCDAASFLRRQPRIAPLLIFFCESFPGEFPAPLFERIRHIFPLVPTILLGGTLCQGEGRTGHLPPGVVRLYYYQWESFGRRQLIRFLAGEPGRFSIPPTATWDDFYRNAAASRPEPLPDRSESEESDEPNELLPFVRPEPQKARPKDSPEICVISPSDREMERLLLELARSDGRSARASDWKMLESDDEWRPKRFLIDSIAPSPADELPRLEEIARRFPDAEIDLLVFAPRPYDAESLGAIPRLRLIAKPFELSVFLTARPR